MCRRPRHLTTLSCGLFLQRSFAKRLSERSRVRATPGSPPPSTRRRTARPSCCSSGAPTGRTCSRARARACVVGSNMSTSRCCCCCCCSEVPQGVPAGVHVLLLLLGSWPGGRWTKTTAPTLRLLVPRRAEQRHPHGTDHVVVAQQPVVMSRRRLAVT